MPAYAIGHITIKAPEKWDEYRSLVPGTLAPWGAELLFRGEKSSILSEEHSHRDTVILRFPDTDSVEQWYNSAAYQKLIPLRIQAADIDLISYDSEQ